MDSVLKEQPLTPSRARSTGPHQQHTDPMEDADSPSTRKRPRLDSGDRVRRSMSAGPSGAIADGVELAKAPASSPSVGQTSQHARTTAKEPPPMALTPSKVTINVRESSDQPSPTQNSTRINGAPSAEGGDGDTQHLAGNTESSNILNSSSPNVISVTTSPSHSPEIEIAEVEDMNGDPGETRWKRLDSAATATTVQEAKDIQTALLDQFPHTSRQTLRKTVALIAVTLEKGDLGDGDLLDNLATWIESYLQTTETLVTQWWDMVQDERAFWDDLPSLVEALMHRSASRAGTVDMVYSNSDAMLDNQSPLQNFLVAFSSLALRMARMDYQLFNNHSEDNGALPELISDRYLHALSNAMNYNLPFWKHLIETSSYDCKITITAMMNRFIQAPEDGIALMTSLSREVLDRSQKVPGLIQKVFVQLAVVCRLVQHYHTLRQSMAQVDEESAFHFGEVTNQGYELFQLVNEKFQEFISKQVPTLSIDVSQGFVKQLSLLLRYSVASDNHLLQKVQEEKNLSVRGLGREDRALLAELAWKFETLKKCIFDGRMEIRVQGVDTMQVELVNVYNKFISNSPAPKAHPIPQYLSDFMLANRLVEYLVGVESHPQLIHRSHNIIGFLFVTNRYSEAETDIIWRAVTDSQDSRFIEAILGMLPNIFGIAQYPVLLYLTTKLNELPISAFDGSMVSYAHNLLENLRTRWRFEPSNPKMDIPPFHLCIRLIRQAATLNLLDTSRRRQIHNFATGELGYFLHLGPSDRDRRTIYQECIQDISDRNEAATGSVSAITTLLLHNPEKEFASVTREWDLAHLVVGEFSYKIKTAKSTDVSSLAYQESLEPRMFLIQNILLFVPDTITVGVGTQLWDCAVGSEASSHQAREMAWMQFLSVIRKISIRNCYIDQCVREHLPRLHPRFYTLGCLHFAQEISHYHFRSAVSRTQEDVKQETTAEDLLWHISLAALPGTIERKAIAMLVALYLDSPENTRRTRAAIEAIHVEVVERCVQQLTSAALKLKSFSDGTSSGEDEPMVIVASDDEVQRQRLSFARSLTILKEFIWGVRARPKYSPQLQTHPQLTYEPHEAKGDTVQVRYQAFGGGSNGEMRIAEVGNLETMHDFASRLKLLTGFSKFTLISGGQKVDMRSIFDKTLQDLRLDQKGLLLVKKDPDTETTSDSGTASGLRPVEAEILSHFHDLYPLLGMEERLAKEMLEFLIAFPPHNSITALVCSEGTPLATIFPPSAPFKVLYSTHALRQSLAVRTQDSPHSGELTIHCIRSLTAALTMLNFSIGAQGAEVDITVAATILQCLLQALKEPMFFAGTESLFLNASALLIRLQTMLQESLALSDNLEADVLASTTLAVILKISLHVEAFWRGFKDADMCSMLLRRLVLDEPNVQVRRRAAESVRSICIELHLTPTTSAQEFIPYLWESIVAIIPYCLGAENTSQEFFELAITIFQCMDNSHRDTLDLAHYVSAWSLVLLRHERDEFVGRETIDWVVNGLSTLLNWVFQYAKSAGKALPVPDDLLVDFFQTHLFPPIPDFSERDSLKTWVPTLHSFTRQELYSIILMLSNDLGNYQKLMTLVSNVLLQGEGSYAWAHGFAQLSEDYHFDQNWNTERQKTMRSPTGYPGIRNLSNTCYMNSLLTQLFMNIKFRGFMLGMKVADGLASQKLLMETQTLLGYMQDTMLRAVDSQGIVDSLVTFENTFIDVSVQMDVDEFYNLLFDRWEAQILSAADKKTFRGFYGGHIVQQIKSKECPHISEKVEPFSAIQCDIHGKATLMDSLNAYVSGETMEGDNKYSCTSCNSYVNAVKRACLKDIPDNLIFHLKRFDYDVMTGMRSKINDAFEFPLQIDMAPYHIDYQKDSSTQCVPDMFELVGVLVHSGTAESGHYYSYIRQPPQVSADDYNWVEFNDMDVTKFDPNNIADQCFGGYSEATHYAHRFQKNWNAYMLFYERIEPKICSAYALPTTSGVPVRTPVPQEIERQIISSNAQYLRNYCLYDPAHAAFARQFLEQLRDVNNGICSDDHVIEKKAIWMSLDYLERVLPRSKDCSEFLQMLASLTRVIGSCAFCCRLALDWVKVHEHALRDLLLRCPNPKVRKEFASMIVMALKYLKRYKPQWYGFQDLNGSSCESSARELHPLGIFPHIAFRLSELWSHLAAPSHARGWDDYFGLLTELANLGVHEVHTILNRTFLRNCLELLVVDHVKASRLRNEQPHYSQYCRLLDKGRKYSLKNLIEFLAILLDHIDLSADWLPETQERQFSLQGMQLTREEDELMQMGSDMPRSKNTCVFLEKILNAACNPDATRRIVKRMTLAEPQFNILEHVQKTIRGGINIDPAHLAKPYLEAAITFCEATPYADTARGMIQYIASEVDTIGEWGGKEHLQFFAQARRIVSLRQTFPPGFFNLTVLRAVPQWAPALLHFCEEPVRLSTVELLKHLVFDHDIRAMDDEEHADLIETAARDLQVACTRRCNGLVQLQKHVDPKTVEQITSVIRHCITHYYSAEEDQRPVVEADSVLTALDILTISDVDEAASETWNNASDDMGSDSDDEIFTTSP